MYQNQGNGTGPGQGQEYGYALYNPGEHYQPQNQTYSDLHQQQYQTYEDPTNSRTINHDYPADPRSQGSQYQTYEQQQTHDYQTDPRSHGGLHQQYQQYQQYDHTYDNIGIARKPHTETQFDTASIDSDRHHVLRDNRNPNEFVVTAPEERFRLGYLDVMALVVNRMIGTGIFNSPQSVMQGTHSTGISLLFWFAGVVYCVAGAHVYVEYGLNVPRYIISGIEQSVPRSGGDLNYIQYVFRKPAYRNTTFMLSTVIFGFGFIAFGNMAGNCVSFANRALLAADVEQPSNAVVRGIALGVAVATCFIHAISRRGGIWLNNTFALIKIGILLMVLGVAMAVGAGLKNTKNVFSDNVTPSHAFGNISHDSNGYSEAFLAIIFTISGFEQPTYVLAEIRNPRRRVPVSMVISISTVLVLYMAVNVAYMVVVPADLQISGDGGTVAEQFFELSIGRVSPDDSRLASRIFNAFLAVSSLGNIIVMTYTAARVKQEIAKEGILPWTKFWAQNSDLSIGRLLHWLQRKGFRGGLFKYRWFRPEQHSEKTPVGAFILHLIACIILILATWRMTPSATYTLLSHVTAYMTHCVFGTFLGLGILILRFYGPPGTAQEDTPDGPRPSQPKTWTEMTRGSKNPLLSVLSALIYMVGSLYPVIAAWVKPKDAPSNSKWYLVPSLAWIFIVLALVWWTGFLAWSRTSHRKHEVFVVEKKPEFEPDNGGAKRRRATGESGGSQGHGGLVLAHETVFLSWVAKENLRKRGESNEIGRDSGGEAQEMLYQGSQPMGEHRRFGM